MMYKIEVNTLEELNVVEKALIEFNRIKKEYNDAEEYLKTKKFQMGDYIIKDGTSYFDGIFNTGDGSIGKIVDYDFENNYYRVYFNEVQSYQGVTEDRLKKYEGEVPSELYIKQTKEIDRILVTL